MTMAGLFGCLPKPACIYIYIYMPCDQPTSYVWKRGELEADETNQSSDAFQDFRRQHHHDVLGGGSHDVEEEIQIPFGIWAA